MRVFLIHDLAKDSHPATEKSWPCLTLRIATPRAAPGFDTQRMAYTRPGETLQYFAWHEWADTPARLLAVLAEARLDREASFGSVLSGAADVATDLRLELQQVSLLQTVQGTTGSVTLQVKAQIVDTATRRMLGSQRFSISEAAAATPAGGVAAAERAVTQVLDGISAFITTSVGKRTCDNS